MSGSKQKPKLENGEQRHPNKARRAYEKQVTKTNLTHKFHKFNSEKNTQNTKHMLNGISVCDI